MNTLTIDRVNINALNETIQDTRAALRFVTCGSVDDGKSTLIGRLLVDSKTVLQDQLAPPAAASAARWCSSSR